MVLKVFGFPTSTCTRRVGVVLEELNIPYELIVVSLPKNEQKSAAFLEHQPFGVVPYIVDDDGYEIYESRAIARYLAAKCGSSLLPSPSDLHKWGKFEQAASIEQSNFDVFAASIAAERVFRPAKGLTSDENIAQRHTEALAAKLDVYDVILSRQRYLAGDECTLADLFHLPYGAMITKIGINLLEDESRRPHVARWWKDISSRDSWQKVKDNLPLTSSQ
ncbi:thioredoxin-like protein [Cristinia sonorae]|uniref:glutathione transferase n=1 Tax=Cristinia sonorae TaxID=1940300 RepID=A0A8K0UF78_9AGAR|nr:thioredoxin-like protein [Cristinia sonorae]